MLAITVLAAGGLGAALLGVGWYGILLGVSVGAVLGMPSLGAALWYRLSIEWADEHGGWTQTSQGA